jgi:hypothetical protein
MTEEDVRALLGRPTSMYRGVLEYVDDREEKVGSRVTERDLAAITIRFSGHAVSEIHVERSSML